MKMTIKKSILLTTTVALLVSFLLCPVAADQTEQAKPRSLLALGDSLTTGFGLDNYEYGGTPYLCNSYINQIARAMGLEGGTTYINRSVNGDRSEDLAKLLPRLADEVTSADMIIITIGGNDLLSTLPAIASQIAGSTVTDSAQAIQILAGASSDTYEALASSAEFQALIATIITNFATNLKTISDFIQEKAPNARVIFLQQFNPMNKVPGYGAAGDFAGTILASLNSTLAENCRTYGFEVIDVPSVIDENAATLTNILKQDIHPNEQGHTEIAKLLAKHLGLSLGLSDETEEVTQPVETSAPAEETTAPSEETTSAPESATEPVTDAPETPAQTTVEPPSETLGDTEAPEGTEPVKTRGCAASVGVFTALLASACAALVFRRREH